MSKIIIHDKEHDSSIVFLEKLYEREPWVLPTLGRNLSKSKITRSIMNNDEIWMLGHGGSDGLYSRHDHTQRFDKYLISSRNVQHLRGKKLFGMWCYANKFAQEYKLNGLFSGMIISEQTEAEWVLGLRVSKETIENCNRKLIKILNVYLKTHDFSEIPDLMLKHKRENETDDERKINDFNFKSWYYYGK